MRRRKDPIPPGAEIYWGHRASFAVLGWMLTLPALFLAAIVWNDRRSGTGDWIAVALFFLFTAGLWLVIAGLMRSYMLIDGDRVEIRVFSGKVIRFTLGEITGYRFGPLLRRPVIRQYPTLLLYRNGERLPADFLQIPGSDRLRERLRERGLQPQLLTPEERAGRFPLNRKLRIEGDTLVRKGEHIPLSEIEARREGDLETIIFCRKNGERVLPRFLNDSIVNKDLLALALERNGVTVGGALPKL